MILIVFLYSAISTSSLQFSSPNTIYSPLINTYYHQYSLNLSIGTPPQSLPLVLGLQTSWTWMQSSICPCNSKYSPNSSNTHSKTGENLTLYYEIGSIESEKCIDTLIINNNTLKNFQFLVSFKETKLGSLKSSGVLGLGIQQHPEDFPSIIEIMNNEGIIDQKLFSLFLAPKGDNQESFVTFGGYDEELCKGKELVSIDADTQNGFWKVKIDHVEYGGVFYDINPEVLIDIGTSMIYVDKRVAKKIKKYLKSLYKCYSNIDYFCEIPSKDVETLSILSIGLGGYSFNIPASNYLSCLNITCKVQISSLPSNTWILGIPFLLSFYSIYNIQSSQILFLQPVPLQSSLYPLTLFCFLSLSFYLLFSYKRKSTLFSYQKL